MDSAKAPDANVKGLKSFYVVRVPEDERGIEKLIATSEYTAKTSEAFAAVERLRLANEGAARENIRQAITEMAALTL